MITRVLSRALPAIAVGAALALFAAGCGTPTAAGGPHRTATAAVAPGGGSFPVSIATANGTVRIAHRPTAIISLAPNATEMLYAIGAGSQVKAVDKYSDYPPGAPRTSLSGLTPNIEAIVAKRPDLVVVTNYAPTLSKQLAPFGIPVLASPEPSSLAGVYAEFVQLGQATGRARQAEQEVASLRSQIAAIVASAPRHARPLTYYYELGQAPYYSVTSDTVFGKLLGLLGMKSIADAAKGAAASGGFPQLSAEFILRANPDYIILADTVCCHQSAATVAARPGWADLTAVKDGHVIALNDDIASRWGPRIIVLLRTVLAALKAHG